jgi:transposase
VLSAQGGRSAGGDAHAGDRQRLDGYGRAEAAQLAGMSGQALRDAIERFDAEGIDGPHDRPRSGRPRRLTADQEAEVKAAVLAGPDIERDGLSAFTLNDIRFLIAERHGVDDRVDHVGRLMRRWGPSRQKARPGHPKKDEAAATALKRGAGELRKIAATRARNASGQRSAGKSRIFASSGAPVDSP